MRGHGHTLEYPPFERTSDPVAAVDESWIRLAE